MTRPLIVVSQEVHDLGGMERAVLELIKAEHSRRHITVVAREVAPDLQSLVRWERIRLPGRPMSAIYPLFYLAAGLRVRTLRRQQPDSLVHTVGAVIPNYVDIATVPYCHRGALRRTGRLAPATAPLIRRVNTAIVHGLAVLAEGWSYRPQRVSILAAVSPGVAEEVAQFAQGVQISVTPNAVDAERFAPDPALRRQSRSELGAAPETVVVLFVGGDWDRKGLDLLIDSLGLLAASGTSLALWVVGRGDRVRYEKRAEARGIADDVRFIAPTSALSRYYCGADIFCLPTQYETFSMVAYEAAAAGLPIVATAAHGIADLIGVDEDAGVFVQRDTGAIASALRSLASDGGLRAQLGHAARQRAAHFSWDRSTASVAAIYAQLERCCGKTG